MKATNPGGERGSTGVFGEGELAVIHLRLSLHLVLGLPVLIVRVAGVLDVNIPQIIRHIIWDGEVKVNIMAAPTPVLIPREFPHSSVPIHPPGPGSVSSRSITSMISSSPCRSTALPSALSILLAN